MSKRNNIYTGYWSNPVAAGGGIVQSQFAIRAPQRSVQIKSISIDWFMFFTATNIVLPILTTTSNSFGLAISPTVNSKMARMFIPTGGTGPTSNGDNIIFTQPGVFHFDSFFFTNEILFTLNFSNFEAANQVRHNLSLMVETEEDIIR